MSRGRSVRLLVPQSIGWRLLVGQSCRMSVGGLVCDALVGFAAAWCAARKSEVGSFGMISEVGSFF